MRSPLPISAISKEQHLPGPALIAVGLAVLLAGAWWPAMPVTTGVALVALGATGSLVNQLKNSPALRPAMAVHLFIYVSLYLLFVGAVAHAAMTGPGNGLSFMQGLDLGVSAGLMTLAVRVGLTAMGRGGDAPARW